MRRHIGKYEMGQKYIFDICKKNCGIKDINMPVYGYFYRLLNIETFRNVSFYMFFCGKICVYKIKALLLHVDKKRSYLCDRFKAGNKEGILIPKHIVTNGQLFFRYYTATTIYITTN